MADGSLLISGCRKLDTMFRTHYQREYRDGHFPKGVSGDEHGGVLFDLISSGSLSDHLSTEAPSLLALYYVS